MPLITVSFEECDVECDIDYQPYEKATWNYPGMSEDVCVNDYTLIYSDGRRVKADELPCALLNSNVFYEDLEERCLDKIRRERSDFDSGY